MSQIRILRVIKLFSFPGKAWANPAARPAAVARARDQAMMYLGTPDGTSRGRISPVANTIREPIRIVAPTRNARSELSPEAALTSPRTRIRAKNNSPDRSLSGCKLSAEEDGGYHRDKRRIPT